KMAWIKELIGLCKLTTSFSSGIFQLTKRNRELKEISIMISENDALLKKYHEKWPFLNDLSMQEHEPEMEENILETKQSLRSLESKGKQLQDILQEEKAELESMMEEEVDNFRDTCENLDATVSKIFFRKDIME
ncbi:hypothetical protein KI387_022583, partial [Taxus chinensis]